MRFVLTLLLVSFALHSAQAGDQEDCRAVDNFDRAIQACTRMIESPRTSKDFLVWATYNRGSAYERKGEYDRAIADYDKVLVLEPQYLLAYYGRAVSFLRKGELERAKAEFDTTLALNPEFIEALYSRGIVHYDLGTLDKALADFDAAIALKPDHAAAFSRRAMVHEQRREFPKAIADYRRALAITPSGKIHDQAHAYSRSRLIVLGVQTARTTPDQKKDQPPPEKGAFSHLKQHAAPINLGRRVALIIGNGAYRHTDRLTNPAEDARAVAASLKRLGFKDVIEGIDLDVGSLADKVRDFSRALKNADLAFFYYAGHGLQVNGLNYMVPIDAKLAEASDIHAETIEFNDVLKHMERQSKTNIVILDASRNNPLASNLRRTMGTGSVGVVGEGLAEVRSSVGTLIVFATQPGNVAIDGAGKHSPFTAALLKHMEAPNMDISLMLRRVRDDVIDSTRGQQVPWEHSSLRGAPIVLSASKDPTPLSASKERNPCPDPNICTPVPIFFATDRKPLSDPTMIDFSGDRDATTHLGQAIVTVPRAAKRKLGSITRPTFWDRAVGGVPARGDPAKHFTIAEGGIVIYARAEELLDAVAHRMANAGEFREHAFVFVHGANTSFEFALYRTAQIAFDLGSDGQPFGTAFLFSWASALGVENYKYDFDSARFAAQRLSDFLMMVVEKTEARHVHVIAHSMGNWPVLAALNELPKTSKLGQVILAAPDVDAEEFTRMAARIVPLAKGMTLYTSSNDVALVAARRVHRNAYRAGDVSPDGPVIVAGIDTIDASSISTAALSVAHSEYAERRELLNDIALLLRKGERPPSSRSPILEVVRAQGKQYWRFPAN